MNVKRVLRAVRPVRRSAPPRVSFEEIEIHTEDGVALRGVVDDPPEDMPFLGTCVLAHAMFARKSEFGRRDGKGLANAYAALGWRTIAFDFRGHGDSVLPAGAPEWGYDDLVRRDLPAVLGAARARSEGRPVIVVGHSLGAHTALASQGAGYLEADGIIAIAGSYWLRDFEPSRLRWAAKVGLAGTMLATVSRLGHFPARSLRMGSDDASGRFARDVLRGVTDDVWTSADGKDDYLAGLSRVTVPVCVVSSEGDRMLCPPRCAEACGARCKGPLEIIRVTRADDGGPPPGHMELVTTEGARQALISAIAWMQRHCP